MKKVGLFSLLPLLCLTSCGKEAFSYSEVNDLTKDYLLFRNTSDDVFGRESNAEEIIYRASKGEGVLFVYLSDTCSTCSVAKVTYKEAIKPYDLDVSVILNQTSSEANKINEYIARNSIEKRLNHPVMSGATPTMYLLNDKVLTEVAYGTEGSQEQDTKQITNTLKAYTSITPIFRANDAASMKDLVYFYDGDNNAQTDFFYDIFYPKALTSQLEVSFFDIKGLSESEKASLSSVCETPIEGGLIYNKKAKQSGLYSSQDGIDILNAFFAE